MHQDVKVRNSYHSRILKKIQYQELEVEFALLEVHETLARVC